MHYGGDVLEARFGIAALKTAFIDAAPSASASWVEKWYPSFWAWKNGDSGGDTVDISDYMSGRIIGAPTLLDTATRRELVAAIEVLVRGVIYCYVNEWRFLQLVAFRANSMEMNVCVVVIMLEDCSQPWAVSYTHLTLPTNREV